MRAVPLNLFDRRRWQMDWRDDIRARFPDWDTEAAALRWPEVKARLIVGQPIEGVVVARAPFGVWLDVGVGHPALLLVPEMEGAQHRRIAFEDYPATGRVVAGRVVGLGDRRCEIHVSQRHPDGVPWAEAADA